MRYINYLGHKTGHWHTTGYKERNLGSNPGQAPICCIPILTMGCNKLNRMNTQNKSDLNIQMYTGDREVHIVNVDSWAVVF